jgi:hypothetical protein
MLDLLVFKAHSGYTAFSEWHTIRSESYLSGPLGVGLSGAENGPRTRSQENRIREHVPVLKSHTTGTSVGGVKRTSKNQHGGQEETSSVRSGTGLRPCFQGYHSRPFETTERVRAFSARFITLKNCILNTPTCSRTRTEPDRIRLSQNATLTL